MIIERLFYNFKCDSCGSLLDEEQYHDMETLSITAPESNWFTTKDNKHYCPDCWSYDDEDNIITKNGLQYTEEREPIQ